MVACPHAGMNLWQQGYVRDELPYLMADRIKNNRKAQEQDISIKEMPL